MTMNFKITTLVLLACMAIGCKKNKEEVHVKQQLRLYPKYVASEAGKDWNVFGVNITGKILSKDTNGDYTVIVTETDPNSGPPKHIHENEDELFYVIKGKYIFYCGEEMITVEQGDMIRLPRGIPHHFINTDTIPGITMNTITPGGFEGFFDDIAKISQKGKPSQQEVDQVAKKYGVTFLRN